MSVLAEEKGRRILKKRSMRWTKPGSGRSPDLQRYFNNFGGSFCLNSCIHSTLVCHPHVSNSDVDVWQ